MAKKTTGLTIVFGAVLGALSVAGISIYLKSREKKKDLAEEDIELTEIDLEPGDPSQDIPGRTYITLVSGSEDEDSGKAAPDEEPAIVKISSVTVEEELDGESV